MLIERYIQIQPDPGKVGVPLVVEVATTEAELDRGLMFRTELPENRGMLFVYSETGRLSFWMKNTFVPLTIAYLDAKGYILELYDAEPLDETSIYSVSNLCMYALEVNQGWFKRHGLGVGSKVLMPDNFNHYDRNDGDNGP